jgi:hypothetical protein
MRMSRKLSAIALRAAIFHMVGTLTNEVAAV